METIQKTKRFVELETRIIQLEDHLLNEINNEVETSDIANTEAKIQDYLKGYRLLIHAEIEHYIEEMSFLLVKKAFSRWKSEHHSSFVLTSILVYTDLGLSIKQKDDRTKNILTLDDRVNKAVTNYFRDISQNHGIKEDNLVKLLTPLGVGIEQLDQAWVATMNSFGSDRGTIAHKSARASQAIDASTEKNTISIILAGLKDLDEIFNSLLTQI
ncbi:HEPN domain-containing protein [Priestia aryabhattai]|uniref:HEPN domain-containing protein n=1 Tax=Priestia aryabhattai TaxID=412384 RepID=UPI003D28542A